MSVCLGISLILPEVDGFRTRDFRFEGQQFVLDLTPTRRTARCPLCHRRSRRVHSHYRRILDDLPIRGHSLRLHVWARRFFCDRRRCPRRVFTERLGSLAGAYARRTLRLTKTQGRIGLALGGNAGARLSEVLALGMSPSTCLRQIMQFDLPSAGEIRILGVDDWAIRRGHRYGTLLYDLERHRVIDLLPDRSAASFAQWLKEHPGIEVISRDRAGCYAPGATEGAPLARQIADRWHLMAIAGDALERVLIRHHCEIKEVARSVSTELRPSAVSSDFASGGSVKGYSAPLPSNDEPAIEIEAYPEGAFPFKDRKPPSREVQESIDRRARWLDRYTEVWALNEQGMSQRAIARTLGLDRKTVCRCLQSETFPERATGRSRVRPLDPFGEFLSRRWAAGCRNVSALWREVRDQGFSGSRSSVQRYLLSTFGPQPRESRRGARPATMAVPSARSIVSMILARAELPPTEQLFVDCLNERCPEVKRAIAQVLAFHGHIRNREWARFDEWQSGAEASEVSEIVSFARGLSQDREAVVAAMTYEWSNGQIEGSVNRPKLIKRSMYGRAGFELLRRRVLHAS